MPDCRRCIHGDIYGFSINTKTNNPCRLCKNCLSKIAKYDADPKNYERRIERQRQRRKDLKTTKNVST